MYDITDILTLHHIQTNNHSQQNRQADYLLQAA